uniref:hypothetical protein n=1 Tax=Bacillus cytotoxicus TaxID=580165 RepID=UPI00203C3942
MLCLNKKRKRVARYFLLCMAVTCVLESQVGFTLGNSFVMSKPLRLRKGFSCVF